MHDFGIIVLFGFMVLGPTVVAMHSNTRPGDEEPA